MRLKPNPFQFVKSALTTFSRHHDHRDVIVLDEPRRDSFRPRRRLQARSVGITRSRLVSAALIAAIIVLHVAGVALLERSTPAFAKRSASSEATVMAVILPKIREGAGDDLPNLSTLVVQLHDPFADLHIEQPQINFEVVRNSSALSAAPTLVGLAQPDMSAYVRQASLPRGAGATIVLRIEVLESGDPGQILIDTSSGSQQTDQAAIDYARTLHWNAGRVNGTVHAIWIRWAVRLQA
jgi:TonB family protein